MAIQSPPTNAQLEGSKMPALKKRLFASDSGLPWPAAREIMAMGTSAVLANLMDSVNVTPATKERLMAAGMPALQAALMGV